MPKQNLDDNTIYMNDNNKTLAERMCQIKIIGKQLAMYLYERSKEKDSRQNLKGS